MSSFTYKDIPALLKKHGSLSAICRREGVTYGYMHRRYMDAVAKRVMEPVNMGRKSNADLKNPGVRTQRVKALKTKRDTHHTFILTSAQNNTDVHLPTWTNLLALAENDSAKVFVSQFLYGKRGHNFYNPGLDKAQIKRGAVHMPKEEIWFDPRVEPFINNDRVEIAKGLVWCGEFNIIPTAVSPLTGLEVYTGRKSMIVPHVTQQMQSIASYGEGSGAKLNYCTGTVTQRNYIQRKEGFKAEFHHMYGALIVEVDEAGHWWVRQLNADSDGTIYDLDRCVKDGVVTTGHRVEAITSGDTHEDEKDETVDREKYRKGGMKDVLRPRFEFKHDVLDFARRNHHNLKDPYYLIEQHLKGRESVGAEIDGSRNHFEHIYRPWCETVVVDSNHDRALEKWLTNNDGRFDPVNAKFWSWLNAAKIDMIERNDKLGLFGFAVVNGKPGWLAKYRVRFLQEDEGFITCKAFGGGIENGMHGDRAANGARGNIRSFAKMGRRSNVGHSHACGIFQGCYQAGTNSKLKLRYNVGASSWSQTDIITYPNGKRTLVTWAFGKWRA